MFCLTKRVTSKGPFTKLLLSVMHYLIDWFQTITTYYTTHTQHLVAAWNCLLFWELCDLHSSNVHLSCRGHVKFFKDFIFTTECHYHHDLYCCIILSSSSSSNICMLPSITIGDIFLVLTVCAERYSRAAGELPGSHDGWELSPRRRPWYTEPLS